MNTPENNKRTRLDNWAIGLLGVAVVVLGLMYLGQSSATSTRPSSSSSSSSSVGCDTALIGCKLAVVDGNVSSWATYEGHVQNLVKKSGYSATRIGDMTVASRDGWRRNRSSATCLDVLINVNRAVPDGTQIGKIEEIFALIASGR